MISLNLNLKNGIVKIKTSDFIEVFFPAENLTVKVSKNSYHYNEIVRQTTPQQNLSKLGYKIVNLSEKPKPTKSKKSNIFTLINTLTEEEKQNLLNLLKKDGDKNEENKK